MNGYLLTELPHDIFNAGFKAKNDVRAALSSLTDLTVKERFRFDKIPTFLRLLWRLGRLPKGATLYIQCPIYSFFNEKFLPALCRVVTKRRLRMVLIIHDVESLRFPEKAARLLPVERQLFAVAEGIIVHNEAMMARLQASHGVPAEKMTVLGIFDYLYDGDIVGADEQFTRTVFVAGNLDPEKSGYVYRLGQLGGGVHINLYGGHFDEDAATDAIAYQGAFPPDELPRHLKGNFGLIWDGPVLDRCAGQTGDYLRINNPHKTSLYLAAGFPVIIWKQAALAPFITENGLGLAVDSLEELPALFDALTEEDYRRMVEQAAAYGEQLRDGGFMRRAAEAAVKKI